MNIKQEILNLNSIILKQKKELLEKDIILLTNTRNKTEKIGSLEIQYADENEFFKEEEYEQILNGLKDAGYFVKSYFNELNFINDILAEKINYQNIIVYNLSRNGNKEGKKSLIPSFCDLLSIPYTGSNAFSISLCRNKYIFSNVLRANDIPTPNSWLYLGNDTWSGDRPPVGTKIIAKPAFESASIGLDSNCIFTYHDTNEILQKLFIQNNNNPLIVQEFIPGYECEVPFFRQKTPLVLCPVGISLNSNPFLGEKILTEDISDDEKYSFYFLKELLPQYKIEEIRNYCQKTAMILGIQNYGRIDFRIDVNHKVYITDIAASPFTTKHSSMAFIFKEFGIPYSTIYSLILGCKI